MHLSEGAKDLLRRLAGMEGKRAENWSILADSNQIGKTVLAMPIGADLRTGIEMPDLSKDMRTDISYSQVSGLH